jgi:hypothetical protein
MTIVRAFAPRARAATSAASVTAVMALVADASLSPKEDATFVVSPGCDSVCAGRTSPPDLVATAGALDRFGNECTKGGALINGKLHSRRGPAPPALPAPPSP